MRMSKKKKNNLVKERKLCKIFSFIDDLSSINETHYCAIYLEELHLGKKILMKMRLFF